MCGILAVFEEGKPNEKNFEYALRMQHHRGPDSSNFKVVESGKILMGTNRLHIQDFAGGAQPMSSDDGSVTIIFNGEIFNFIELKNFLKSKSVNLHSSHSDTELLLRLYLEVGTGFVNKLNGMFSIIIYDSKTRILSVFRDHVGIKPLHYFFKDEISLRSILQNCNDNLKIGGYLIGTTFDGERIYNALKGKLVNSFPSK